MQKPEYMNITTPTGRIVSGNPFTGRTTDGDGNALLYKNGPRAGQQRTEYRIGLAVPKADAAQLVASLEQKAAQDFPTLFGGGAKPAGFAFKYLDGDDTKPNSAGSVPAQKEGYPGNFVFWFTSDTAPACYEYGKWEQELLGGGIKCGDYAMISGSVVGNGNTQNPGLYLNLDKVAKVADGPEISNRPTAAQAFAGTTPNVPAGATPPAVVPGPGAAAAPVPAVPPQAMPPQPAAPPTTPHTGILNPQAAAPAPAPAAPAPAAKRLYQGVAYEPAALLAAGWAQADIDNLPPA